MEQSNLFRSGKNPDDKNGLWYVDNYVLLKDYYDRTISRIAARCVRQGNIAMEEYPFYGYILDVLEEISETGDYILGHQELYSYVEKRIAGGVNALRKNLLDFKTELKNNATPEMIKQDKDELNRMKAALGALDKSKDPTIGAGMSMDEVVDKLMHKQQEPQTAVQGQQNQQQKQPQSQNAPRPQQQGQAPRQNQPQGQNQQQRQPQSQNAPRPQQQGQAPRQNQPQGQNRPQEGTPFNRNGNT